MSLAFDETTIPDTDEAPPIVNANGDYDPEFPGSTPDAPYGFKDNGDPYKRRPGPRGPRKSGRGSMPASESQARSAAALLGQLNLIIGISLSSLGFPMTASAVAAGNDTFTEQAYAALLTDPALCRKILGAGAQSGKAALVMAYGMLVIGVVPAATAEFKERRATLATERTEEVDAA